MTNEEDIKEGKRSFGKAIQKENKWVKEVPDTKPITGEKAIEECMKESGLYDLLDTFQKNLEEAKYDVSKLKPIDSRRKLECKDIRNILNKYNVEFSDFKVTYYIMKNLKIKIQDDDFNNICNFVKDIYRYTYDIYQPYREVSIEMIAEYICNRLNKKLCNLEDMDISDHQIEEIAHYICSNYNKYSDEVLREMGHI